MHLVISIRPTGVDVNEYRQRGEDILRTAEVNDAVLTCVLMSGRDRNLLIFSEIKERGTCHNDGTFVA